MPDVKGASGSGPTQGSVARIAGRYSVEFELARGGMGVVYAVKDESTGARVALKRLARRSAGATRRKGAKRQRDAALLLQFEYAMLARLRHPSIIEVYDYGVDQSGPYYTMELLDGLDLHEIAPVEFREACRHARDVASSLALLHAHRLIHRDVSPRNVRATRAGRLKLFDFGTLTSFGVPVDIAGTPSSVPPEALNGGPLDHRADLYSLGCLLYWLLVGRDAFPARHFDELRSMLGANPAPPSTQVSSVPSELDALVMSMLSRDPLARPSSAAEVIARLDSIGRLDPEEPLEVAQGYFWSAKTVGRSKELSRAAERIERVCESHGGGLLIEGERGHGKTRFVRELSLEAQLRGATVAVVDASVQSEPNATVKALANRLLQASPEDAVAAASPHAANLARLFPELSERLPNIELAALPDAPGEWRVRIHAALRAWFLALAERRPLVLVVDDIDLADESSVGLIMSLVRESASSRLLVVATAKPDTARSARFLAFGNRLSLGPLDAGAVAEFVRSVFADAPHTGRLARWLHSLSAGIPLHCAELIGHLVESGIVRYGDGAWTLPENTRIESLPTSVDEAVASRLARLRPAARALAEALSVCRTALPLAISIVLADADAGSTDPDAVELLDELVSHGVLVGSGGTYRFAEESLRERLFSALSEDRRKRLHREVGEALALACGDRSFDAIVAGLHLLQGGDEERGATLLADAGRRLIDETDDLHAAVPALEAALTVFRAQKRPAHELVSLIAPLVAASFFVDHRLASRYGPEALELFREATGLARASELHGVLGNRLSLGIAVATATVDRRLSGSSAAPTTTREMLRLFLRCALTLAGVSSVCLDRQGVERVVKAIEPLSGLGEGHGATWICRYCANLEHMCTGNFGKARVGMLQILEQLESRARPKAFPEQARRLFIGGALYAIGAIETLRDGSDVLAYADRLEALDLRLYDLVADQLRMLYHAHRGECEPAKYYRERIEIHAIERGSAWQVEVWEAPVMLLVHVREGNVVGLRRTAEQLERLSAEIPSLGRYADVAKAAYVRLRGDLDTARHLLEGATDSAAGPFPGRPPALGMLAELHNALGEFERALGITEEVLSSNDPEERPFVRMTLLAQIQHAVARFGLGDRRGALSELDHALEEHGPGRGPVTLGLLHQTRARLSLIKGDEAGFDAHRAAMDRWFRPTRNPALISMCERLTFEARRGRVGATQPEEGLEADD
jgi:hypothetical protein